MKIHKGHVLFQFYILYMRRILKRLTLAGASSTIPLLQTTTTKTKPKQMLGQKTGNCESHCSGCKPHSCSDQTGPIWNGWWKTSMTRLQSAARNQISMWRRNPSSVCISELMLVQLWKGLQPLCAYYRYSNVNYHEYTTCNGPSEW